MLTPSSKLTALALISALAATLTGPAQAQGSTERAELTWDTAVDLDLHAWDQQGNHAYYGEPTAISNAILSEDQTVGYGPEFFTDDESPSMRSLYYCVHYYSSGAAEGAPTTTASLRLTDTDGLQRTLTFSLDEDQWANAGSSPPNASGDCESGFAPDPGEAPGPPAVPRLVQRYAPLLYFHDKENYWPMSVERFIEHSRLKWAHDGGCGDHDPDDWETIDMSALGSGGYEHQARSGFPFCNPYGRPYTSAEYTRPKGNESFRAGLEDHEGFYLDLDPDYRDGDRGRRGSVYRGTSSAVYYTWRSRHYIRYWFFYPASRTGFNLPAFGGRYWHEGDWEGIAIKLNSQNRATRAIYYQHFYKDIVPWSRVPRTLTTHPKVFVGRGSHASYRSKWCATTGGGLDAGIGVDQCNPIGKRWYTWKSNGRLRSTSPNVSPWYGFGGAWGDVGVREDRTGPLGPSPYKKAVPGSWL